MAVQAVSPRYLRLVLVASAVGTVHRMVRLLHLREPGRGVVDAVLLKSRSRRRVSVDCRTLYDRLSDQAAWGSSLAGSAMSSDGSTPSW